jgi:hypothetical protein
MSKFNACNAGVRHGGRRRAADGTEESHGDADRADQDVFPRRLSAVRAQRCSTRKAVAASIATQTTALAVAGQRPTLSN